MKIIAFGLLGVVGILAFVLLSSGKAAGFKCDKNNNFYATRVSGAHTVVEKICDEQTQTVCFVVPNLHCVGDCAYTPAISCVKY